MKHLLLYTFLTVTFYAAKAQLNLQWQNLGPDNLGGEVRGLILDNRDPTRQTLYAGCMGGGVWKSTNGGAQWNYLGCPGNYAVSCISQSGNGIIYIGTGDGIAGIGGTNGAIGHLGNGIYKLDSLDNFIHFDSTTASNYYSCWSAVNRIAVNPNNSNQLLAANVCGLYQSTDGGNTWNVITIPGVPDNTMDVKWSTDGTKIFAASGGPFGPEKVIRSTDSGNTWSVLNSTDNPGFPTALLGRTEIAFAPSNSNVAYLSIAGAGNAEGCTYGVIKTTDGGNTWDTVTLHNADFDPFGTGCQGWIDDAIAVSPLDSSKIYVGGYNMYSYSPQTGLNELPPFIDPDVVAHDMVQYLYVINDLNPDEMYVATQQGLFKSSNANTNFTTAQFSASNTGMAARDFISVAAARNGRVMGGSIDDDALLISNSGGQNYSSINTGLGYCYFSQLDTTYAFIEEYYGALYVSNDGLASFVTAFDANIDPQGQNGASRCGSLSPSGNAAFIAPFLLYETKSAFATEDSVAFTSTVGLPAGEVVSVTSQTANTVFPYTLPVALQAGDTLMVPDPMQSKLFLSTNCGLWMKRHALASAAGPDWYKISTTSPACFAVTKNGNAIYFGNEGKLGILSGLNFGNYNAYNMVDSFPSQVVTVSSANISSIAVDPNNDSTLILTTDGYSTLNLPNAYISKDAGQTWESLRIGPSGMPAYTCVIDANNSNNYIVGTEHGIWTSNDAGLTWQQDDDGMCDVPVYQLRQIPLLTDDCYVLYAATNSRGLWRSVTLTPPGCNTSSAINTPLNDSPDGDFRLYPNPASAYTTVEFTTTEPLQVTIRIFDIAGRLIQTSENFFHTGNQKAELNTSNLPAGTYLVNVEAGQIQKTRLLVISE